jgi:hypothetical protein
MIKVNSCYSCAGENLTISDIADGWVNFTWISESIGGSVPIEIAEMLFEDPIEEDIDTLPCEPPR